MFGQVWLVWFQWIFLLLSSDRIIYWILAWLCTSCLLISWVELREASQDRVIYGGKETPDTLCNSVCHCSILSMQKFQCKIGHAVILSFSNYTSSSIFPWFSKYRNVLIIPMYSRIDVSQLPYITHTLVHLNSPRENIFVAHAGQNITPDRENFGDQEDTTKIPSHPRTCGCMWLHVCFNIAAVPSFPPRLLFSPFPCCRSSSVC